MTKKKKAAKKKSAKKKQSRSRSTPSAAERSTGTKTPTTTAAGSDKKKQSGPTIAPVPTAGKKVLDFEKTLDELIAADAECEQLDQEISGISDPSKRTRGRPRKTEPEPASILKQKANPLWPPVLKIPFDVWAETEKIEELRITDKEADLLAVPITQLIDYYLPQLPEIAIAWFGLISAGYSVLGPRRQIIIQRRRDQSKSAPGSPVRPPLAGDLKKKPITDFPNLDEIEQTVKI